MNNTSEGKIKKLQGEIARARTAKHKCSLLIDMAMELRHSNPMAALEEADKALLVSGEINFVLGKARSYFCKGLVHFNLSDYESSFICLDRSFQVFKEAGDKWGMSNALNNIGLIYLRLGDYSKALQNFSSSLQVKKESGDRFGTANVLTSMAAIHRETGNPSDAQMLLAESLEISEQLNSNELISKGLMELGILRMIENKFSEATEKFNEAKRFFEIQNKASGIAQCFLHLGKIRSASGDSQSALSLFEEGQHIAAETGDKSLLTIFLCNKASEKLRLNESTQAIELLNDARKIALKTQEKPILAMISKELSAGYEAIGNLKDALTEYKNFISLKDEIASIETSTILRNHQIISKVEALEKENKLLELERIAALDRMTVLLNEQEIRQLTAMMEGQENERRRIAADLHDRIGSSLSAIKLHLTSFARSMNAYPKIPAEFERINTMFDEAVDEVRQVSHDLASGVLIKFGLVSALRDLSETIGSSGKIKVNFLTNGTDVRVDHQVEISLYRITQELITNILKHAQAKEVTIYLNRLDDHLALMVEDDGVGFDTSKDADGIGMKNLKWRVDKLKGHTFVDSMPGRGCTVSVEVPIT